MIKILTNPVYAKLFSAQIIALLGTGLLTVALGLLAYDLGGSDGGAILGIAMTIKMVAYVAVSPLMTALVARLPRKTVLIAADVLRAAVAAALPFVSETWQIYMLIFVLQSASATFTPTFQAVIPSVLTDEGEYTRALSLSRIAYDLEALVSPVLAAALLTLVSFHELFSGTVMGFLASAVLVLVTRLPALAPTESVPFFERLTRGSRLFWRTRELRGLLALNLVVATATAMVIVNTVVLVQHELGLGAGDVALLLAAYGAGSMVMALGMPAALDRLPDRRVMLVGGGALPLLLLAAAGVIGLTEGGARWTLLLGVWALLGAATATILTPSGRLLRRGSAEADRPALFAAQFSLSHACYLVTYPVAGLLGAAIGLAPTALVLVVVGAVGAGLAASVWRGLGRDRIDGVVLVSRAS